MVHCQRQHHAVGERGAYRPGYEIAAERILAYIAEQEMRAGDRLPTETQLCEILQVSRSVTREAVKVLSALGRINVRKGAGLFVSDGRGLAAPATAFQPSDLNHMKMMFDFRLTVEPEAAGRAAECASPLEVKAARTAAERSVESAGADDFDAFRAADEDFHRAIGAASHNILLSGAVDQITQLKRQVLTIGLRGSASGSLTAAAEQHLQIIEAIGSGDPERAAEAMAKHIVIARSQFQDRITARLRDLVGPGAEA